jgi:hypothetical protein
MLYAIVVFFGNFLDLKIIFGEMFINKEFMTKKLFLKFVFAKYRKFSTKNIAWILATNSKS